MEIAAKGKLSLVLANQAGIVLAVAAMLQTFGPQGVLAVDIRQPVPPQDFVWIDCLAPTAEEEAWIEKLLNIDIPTREEMQALEVSNRLNEKSGALSMSAVMIHQLENNLPEAEPVTFMLTGKYFVTVRYAEYLSFKNFTAEFKKTPAQYLTADAAFVGLQGDIVERLADMLEEVGREIETVSRELFALRGLLPAKKKIKRKRAKPREILNRVGAIGNLDAKIRESVVSLQRVINFLNDTRIQAFAPDSKTYLPVLRADLQALAEHCYFLADKITFLLDANLGLINIEQNDIIQIFSITAVILMPPTLISSIYGMNFHNMHELAWPLGYEYALSLMLLSALIPYLFFKKKGWM